MFVRRPECERGVAVGSLCQTPRALNSLRLCTWPSTTSLDQSWRVAIRKRVLRNICVPIAYRVGVIQRRAVRRMSQVHVNYRSSPLTQPGRSYGLPAAGERAPDVDVVSGWKSIRLYAALRSARHTMSLAAAAPGGCGPWTSLSAGSQPSSGCPIALP